MLCTIGICGHKTLSPAYTMPMHLTSCRSSLCAARPLLSSLEPPLECPLYNLPATVATGRAEASVRRVAGRCCRQHTAGQQWSQDRAHTLNLLSPYTADGSSDQLAFLVLTSASQLRVRGRPWVSGCRVKVLHLPSPSPVPIPCPGPYQFGQLLHIIHRLQPPCQSCEGSLLFGFSLLRAAEI